jgi:uncharacterized delta-60 repeat protein
MLNLRPRSRLVTVIAALACVVVPGLVAVAPAQAAPGDLDPTFSGDGKALMSFGASDYGRDVALQPDGKIVVVGGSYAGAGGTHRFALARFNPDGSLDPSFDADGRVTTEFGNVAADAVALQPDGKIVAVGGQTVARYLLDGSLDPSFGVDGHVATDFGASDVAIQADGRIVVAGAGGGVLALARYTIDGSPDGSFGGDGTVTTDFSGSGRVALQADGKVVAVGNVPGFGGNSDLALARYNADGSLDRSFGVNGKQITDVDWGADDRLAGVAIGPDGTIATVGQSYCFICSSTTLIVALYTCDGSLSGLHMTNVDSSDAGSSVAIQSDGKIVAAGGTIDDFLVARYESGGSPDPSFHDDGVYTNLGVRTTDFGGSDGAAGVALQPDGKIVAAGTTIIYNADGSGVGRFAVARYEGGSVAGTAPANSTAPAISGTATDGQMLTVNPGSWSGSTPMNRSYQWRRCDPAGANCLDIAAASATTYVLVAADVGHTIRVREVATNSYGHSSVDSAATAVVATKPGTAPVSSAPPTISGTATEGQTLTATAGAWAGSTPINSSYQWRRCAATGTGCVDIATATSAMYTLGSADVGHALRLRETATNAYGQSSADSTATGVVKANPGKLTGTVRNLKSGATIANASVNCGNGYTAKTSSKGLYSIPNVAPATYTCTATASGYLPFTQGVDVSPGQTKTADFNLARQ